jgi:hypothetical protein
VRLKPIAPILSTTADATLLSAMLWLSASLAKSNKLQNKLMKV